MPTPLFRIVNLLHYSPENQKYARLGPQEGYPCCYRCQKKTIKKINSLASYSDAKEFARRYRQNLPPFGEDIVIRHIEDFSRAFD